MKKYNSYMIQRVCKEKDCKRKYNCREYCKYHYDHFKRIGLLTAQKTHGKTKHVLCTVEGCRRTHEAHGLCDFHRIRKKDGKCLTDGYNEVNPTLCKIEDCNEVSYSNKSYLCLEHHIERVKQRIEKRIRDRVIKKKKRKRGIFQESTYYVAKDY